MNKALKAWKFIRIIAYILVLIVSMTLLSSHFSSPETYRDAIETLDEQKLTAMGLDVVLASTSTVLTLALDDIATPLANEIADMTDVVFVIICIILAEKFLITTFGWIAFFVAVPASCVCAIANEFAHSEYLRKLILKFLVLAISLVSVIPFGVFLTEQINDTYSDTIQQTFESAMLIAEEGPEVETEGGNAFTDFFVDIKDGVTEFFSDTTGVLDMAKSIINAMVDAIAVLVITNCIVPLFAALLMIWALMWVTNISTPAEKIGKIMRNSINTVKAVRSRVSTDMDDE